MHSTHPSYLSCLQCLSSRLAGGVEVAEVFMLCEHPQEALQEVATLQRPLGVSDGHGIALAACDELEARDLQQRLQQTMSRWLKT